MMYPRSQIILLFFCLFWTAPARAQANQPLVSLNTAIRLYQAGRYEEAVHAGALSRTAKGFALAAQASLVIAHYYSRPDAQPVLIARALEFADSALELDPDNVEAMLHRSVALGLRGRIKLSTRDARQSKKMIDRALALEPENPLVWAAIGGWNGEVVRHAGRFFGSILFGAKFSKSKRAFLRALELDPDSVPIRWAYTNMLLQIRPRREHDNALAQLKLVVQMEPREAFDRFMICLAQEMLLAIEGSDDERIDLLLDDEQPLGLLLGPECQNNNEE